MVYGQLTYDKLNTKNSTLNIHTTQDSRLNSIEMKNILTYTALLLVGLLLGYLFFGGSQNSEGVSDHVAEEHMDDEGNIIYTCSMHPQVRQNEPGDCPICGMELIPADNSSRQSAADNDYTLTMTNAAVKLADIQTSRVAYGMPVHTFTLPGRIVENKNNVSAITAHYPGRIRDLFVDYEGTFVREGQKLASIYSPELIAAQQELLETVKYREQNPRLYEASRRKLLLWEFPESTIDEIEQSGEIMTELDFVSPVSGYVSEIAIAREEHVMEGGLMYRVVDLSEVWIDFQAYESNVSEIEEGDMIRFSVKALPGREFESEVIYVDPFLDNESRSVTIRAEIDNPESRLKPGMLAQAEIRTSISAEQTLLVPRSAVMWTGRRSVVYVQIPDRTTPEFEAWEVEIGQRAGDFYVVASGLTEGDLVVTNGTFKIDSAAQLSDKLSMMNRRSRISDIERGMTNGEVDEMDHSDHQMEEMAAADTTEAHLHDDHLTILVDHYLQMKNALTRDQFEMARNQLEMFAAEVRENSDMIDHDDHSEMHREHHQAMVSAVTEAENAESLESFRLAFKKISDELIKAVENQGYEGTLFRQYCPMYEGGSEWISTSEDIKNPFYGSMMHNCGETVERID